MTVELQGYHKKLALTRYAQKSVDKIEDLKVGGTVVTLVKDGEFPVRELASVRSYNEETNEVTMELLSADGVDFQVGQEFVQTLDSVDVLLENTFGQISTRVSRAIASVEATEVLEELYNDEFKRITGGFLFIPAGRILNGAGDDSEVTLFNCYVVAVDKPTTEKHKHKGRDSRQAIFQHMGKISEIMARGGGVGSNVDVFRPRYTPLSKTKGRSTGAVYIANLFSGLTEFVDQANRRGAQMITMSDWHPDVFYTNDPNHPDFKADFIGAKQTPGVMTGNNSSVLITDEFMEAVENDDTWDLIFPDTKFEKYDDEWDGDIYKWQEKGYPIIVHRTIRAKEMWDKINESNHRSAEPGIIFIDRVNTNHNGWYLGRVNATNPCGEQPILPNSTCNLGAINFGRMIKQVGEDEFGPLYEVDWDLLKQTIRLGVRFLDNVIDKSFYFDEEMRQWQLGERRVGLGGLGVADLFIAVRTRYGSKEGNELFEKLMMTLRDESYLESIELAKERGAFPLFDKEKYLQSGFVKRLPEHIREAIAKYGIRNLTLNTFAPTGTTGSITPSLLDVNGSVSTGIEPHFSMKYKRKSRIGETIQYAGAAAAFMERNPQVTELPDYFVGAMDLSPEEHVAVQAIAQKYIDSAISKTVNAPKDYTVEQCAAVYMNLYKSGCKGGTIYRDGSRDVQILHLADDEETSSINKTISDASEKINEAARPKGKYDDWKCGACGSDHGIMVEGCMQCADCGNQSCSI